MRREEKLHTSAAQAQKEREPVVRFPLKKCLFIRFGLAEVTLQQALQSLAVTGLVPRHPSVIALRSMTAKSSYLEVFEQTGGTQCVRSKEKISCKQVS